MSAQEILTAAFHAVTICFTLLIAYCEVTRVVFSREALQVSNLHQEPLNLSENIALREDANNRTTDKEIDQRQILLSQQFPADRSRRCKSSRCVFAGESRFQRLETQ